MLIIIDAGSRLCKNRVVNFHRNVPLVFQQISLCFLFYILDAVFFDNDPPRCVC